MERVNSLGGTAVRASRHGLGEGKPQLSLVLEFRAALEGAAKALAAGAEKYGRSDWRRGMPQNEVVDSLSRHLVALMSGEVIDETDKRPHVDKILCNALLLSEFWYAEHTDKE